MIVDFQRLQTDVTECRNLLLTIQARLDAQPVSKEPDEETPLTVQQAADFLGIAPQTVYQRIKELPHKKRFGRLYFFRSQLNEYLNAGEGAGQS